MQNIWWLVEASIEQMEAATAFLGYRYMPKPTTSSGLSFKKRPPGTSKLEAITIGEML